MKTLKREIALSIFSLLPLVHLYFLWPSIPETIPLHYGLDGTADRYGDKQELLWFVPTVMVLSYFILAIVPFIDPKRRVTQNQQGFDAIRLVVVVFLSMIMISYFLTLTGGWNLLQRLPLFLMALIVVIGNYLPTIKPNYFLGIRTPWTLEDDVVWFKTHRFSGRLWTGCGLGGLVIFIVWPQLPLLVSVCIIFLLASASMVYSYVTYRQIHAR